MCHFDAVKYMQNTCSSVIKEVITLTKRDLPDSSKLDYVGAIEEIKQQIRRSRYQAARAVNRELLVMYFNIGRILSERIKEEDWGSKILDRISKDIREEFVGIRGFSRPTLVRMRQFYAHYRFLEIGSAVMNQIENSEIGPSLMGQLEEKEIGQSLPAQIETEKIRPSMMAQIGDIDPNEFLKVFFNLSFTHHIILIQKCSDFTERFFYMQEAVRNQWPYRTLQYHIESDLYHQRGQMASNFSTTLPEDSRKYALDTFKSEYLLNFLAPKDDSETTLENEIINNIQDFLEALGSNFTFIGNQYRLVVEGDEFFVDLLFYHRRLRSLIAVELKTGKFRPEFVGKMQFYLTALDELVRHEDENPSIGLILCREKKRTVVEWTLKDSGKPMGVAEYKAVEVLSEKLLQRIEGRRW